MAAKTNAARWLDEQGIGHELRAYDVDPSDLAAETVAAKVGLPARQLFKTLLVEGDRNGFVFAVVPGDMELDLKAMAQASGNRKVQLVPVKDLQRITGYIRGGVTVIGAKKEFPVVADETIRDFDVISISAGMRGLQILLSPADYLRVAKATVAKIAIAKPSA